MSIKIHLDSLSEAASSIIFHTTSLRNAISILETKTLKLSDIRQEESGSWDASQNNNPWIYYFSTSRSPANAFAVLAREEDLDEVDYKKNSIHVTFKLNGDWFNQRGYKAKSIRWGYDPEAQKELEKYKNPPKIDFPEEDIIELINLLKNAGHTTGLTVAGLQGLIKSYNDNNNDQVQYSPKTNNSLKVGDEKEDRIFSRTPIIKINDSGNSCIMECYVFTKHPFNRIRSKKTLESLRKLKSLADSSNIPVKFFDKFNHWLTPIKRASITSTKNF